MERFNGIAVFLAFFLVIKQPRRKADFCQKNFLSRLLINIPPIMKKVTTLLLAFCVSFSANAQCPTSTFVLASQDDVDDFPTDYPGCTDLTVKMTITGANITNLDSLNGIETTLNSIEILDNPMLASLEGLSNLTSIGVEFKIDNNDALVDLTGLEMLASVGGHLSIEGNAVLTTLDGMGPIPSLGSYLNISFNPVLTDITALNSLTEVGPAYVNGFLAINNNNDLPAINGLDAITETGSYLFIGSNLDMTTINGLNGLTIVRGEFSITGNNSLTDLAAFTSLITVDKPGGAGEDLIIDLNPLLTNIDEFDALTTVSGTVNIVSNSALSDCVSDGICAIVDPPGNQAVISNNDLGCDTEAEVEDACEAAPVELIFFKGKFENEEVMLTWQTASEQNNSFFEVEYSLNGKNFKSIGKVIGNGTTLTLSDYQFRHSKPSGGLNYYRLKQVDADGTFAYSNIVSVLVQRDDDLRIFPNPTTGPVWLQGEVQGERTARVTDLSGRLVLEKNMTESALIDLFGQPSGVYLIEIQTENQKIVKRVVKE
jgi:hypothetical protein